MNDLSTDENRHVYSVSELNQLVRSLLEDAFPPLWIEGEISNFSCPSSGHWYFSIKDANAQIRCAMFQSKNRMLIQPKNGTHVQLRAKISLYEARGEFQLIVDFLEEAGEGLLRRTFEELKLKLSAEGLFTADHKKNLPAFPTTIGVITSPTGAAIRDILTVLKRRFPAISVLIYPTAVQGTQAAKQISNAIQLANLRKECDVLILARGGGSLEDLWSFNEETVARAIYASQIPIVSGIGHEIDFTIADFVADLRAPTPSAAAELVSPDSAEYQLQLNKIILTLIRNFQNSFKHYNAALLSLAKLLRHPGQRIQDQFQRLDDFEQRLKLAIKNRVNDYRHRLTTIIRGLDAISPLATLARGFAIVTLQATGEILRDAKTTQAGDKVIARLAHGAIECTVEKIIEL